MKRRLICGFATCLSLLSCWPAPVMTRSVAPRGAPPEAERVERLVGLGKLWAAVKFFHPYLVYRDIDWDGALAAAIPKANAAQTSEEYAAALQGMLSALGDPATRVLPPRQNPKAEAALVDRRERDPRSRLGEDGILIVTISNYEDLNDSVSLRSKFRAIAEDVGRARGVVFDLRRASPVEQVEVYESLSYHLSDPLIVGKLVSVPLVKPGERRRMHSGLRPQEGFASGGFYSGSYTVDGGRIEPTKDARDVPVVFLVNQHGELPALAPALQSAGKAAIIAEGALPNDATLVSKQSFELPHDVKVQMRLGESVRWDNSGGLYADAVIPARTPGSDDTALQTAVALAKDFRAMKAGGDSTPVMRAPPPPDKSYTEMSYPAVEYRLLSAFRIWAVFNYFFPYKDLIGEDWDGVLREFIPKFERAGDETSYALAVAEMTARTNDTHVLVSSPVLSRYFGVAPPPVLVRMIEGVPVVTRMLDEEAAKAAGIEVGDVVLKVDGVHVEDRIALMSKYFAASTPQGLAYRIPGLVLLRGAEGSTATLLIRDGSGREREVKLPRREDYLKAYTSERTGDVLKMLPGNIGYADLNRLTVPEVDGMFERFKDTRAIIFDMRGYPKGTAWAIAPRLTEKISPVGALIQRPIAMSPDRMDGLRAKRSVIMAAEQPIPRSDKWKYKGETVMLIDERVISQAEHTGLFFEAANGTKFIGSHSNGTNGDVTNFFVPGGIRIRLSGQGVRHADGRQLQRVGLVPDVEVKPTIKGIRGGRDEVLEKAIEYLGRGLGSTKVSR